MIAGVLEVYRDLRTCYHAVKFRGDQVGRHVVSGARTDATTLNEP